MHTDEIVRAALTSDDMLDVLESIGYSGIPQKETLSGIQPLSSKNNCQSRLSYNFDSGSYTLYMCSVTCFTLPKKCLCVSDYCNE